MKFLTKPQIYTIVAVAILFSVLLVLLTFVWFFRPITSEESSLMDFTKENNFSAEVTVVPLFRNKPFKVGPAFEGEGNFYYDPLKGQFIFLTSKGYFKPRNKSLVIIFYKKNGKVLTMRQGMQFSEKIIFAQHEIVKYDIKSIKDIENTFGN